MLSRRQTHILGGDLLLGVVGDDLEDVELRVGQEEHLGAWGGEVGGHETGAVKARGHVTARYLSARAVLGASRDG